MIDIKCVQNKSNYCSLTDTLDVLIYISPLLNTPGVIICGLEAIV